MEATSLDALKKHRENLQAALTAIESLIECCDTRFGDFSPSFIKTRSAIEEILQGVRILIGRKPGGAEEEPAEPTETEDTSWAAEEDSVTLGLPVEEEPVAAAPPLRRCGRPPPGARWRASWRPFAAPCARRIRKTPRRTSSCAASPGPNCSRMRRWWTTGPWSAPRRPACDAEARRRRVRLGPRAGATEGAMLHPCGGSWLDLQRYAVNALEQKGFPATAAWSTTAAILVEALPDLVEA